MEIIIIIKLLFTFAFQQQNLCFTDAPILTVSFCGFS